MEITKEKLEQALKFATADDWDSANDILGGFGIEYVSIDQNDQNASELKYINLGDTYDQTICQEYNGNPFIGSWGDWYENTESEKCQKENVIRCGYCGEFTDMDKENWHDVICQSCSHKVDGSN